MAQVNQLKPQEAENLELSFEYLVREYYPYIRRLAYSILDDMHEAEDAAQETFVAAYRSANSFRADAHPKTWLTAIAVNSCRGRLRKRKVSRTLTLALRSLHLQRQLPPTPEEKAIQGEIDLSIWQAVDALGEKHRFPVILRYVHQLDVPEIATILQLSPGTVHSRLHYARKKLHAELGHLNPHQEQPDENTS
ncbi:MAG: RNA polymerase sigma factor [Anaerolineales bacterium]